MPCIEEIAGLFTAFTRIIACHKIPYGVKLVLLQKTDF